MWNTLDLGFQVAFEQAWEAYRHKTFPIGACIVNHEGHVVTKGRNQVFSPGEGRLSRTELAHAEMNALLALPEGNLREKYPRIREYTLYTTMEPCPMCFGAIVMSSIRHVRFAARDGWAGATHLNEVDWYIKSKSIRVEGPFSGPDSVSVALEVSYFTQFRKPSPQLERAMALWEADSPAGKRAGLTLGRSGQLTEMAQRDATAAQAYTRIAALCQSI